MLIPPVEMHRNERTRFWGKVPHFRADAEGGERVCGAGGSARPPGAGSHFLKIAPADPAANFATYENSALPIAPSLVEAIMAFLARHR
jgi:hypothetical protein